MLRLGIVGLGLAHELNSPLTTLAMGLELLQEQLAKTPPPSIGQIVKLVTRQQKQVQRMALLVDHMRALATGRQSGTIQFALHELTQAVFELARPALRELDSARLIMHSVDQELVAVGDRILVEQALCCLVLNAADASGADGTVTLSAARFDQEIRIEVRDTGSGFEDVEAALKLGASTKGGQGMGVGLALVSTIAQDAGGRLQLSNSTGPEGGAVACLVLPALRANA